MNKKQDEVRMSTKRASTNPRQPYAATLQDVANLAGVSRATASTVLNDSRSSTRASEATRERVRQAAADLAYRPNAVARSLRRQATKTIGFYNGFGYVDPRTHFLSSLIAGMHFQCDQSDYDLLIHRIAPRDGNQRQIHEIIGGKVDGVVLYTYMDDPVIDMIVARRFPAVAIADAHPHLPSVTADDEGGSCMVARRLAALGHKRVLYRLPPKDRMSGFYRYSGFRVEAEALGLSVYMGISTDMAGSLGAEEIAFLEAADEIRPTAIVCWTDENALEVYKYCQTVGWTGRFAIIGFDGYYFPWLPVTLTSVRVPWDVVASTAIDALCKVIDGKAVEHRITVPVNLVDGHTG